MKYRIYNKKEGFYLNSFNYLIDQDGYIRFIEETEWEGASIYRLENQEDFIIERSTGLVTLDGTEIYEGDILEDYENKVGYIYFMDGCFWIDNGQSDRVLMAYNNAERSVVVGNINQNRELL